MRRKEILVQIEQANVLDKISIVEVSREAKLGWLLKRLLIAAWPKIVKVLSKKLSLEIIEIILAVLGGRSRES